MAIATGTATAITAGATLAGTLGSAAMQGRAQGRAANAQERSAQQALRFQMQQENARREQEQWRRSDYEKRWSAWDAQRRAILDRYGVSVPGGGGPAPGMASTGAGIQMLSPADLAGEGEVGKDPENWNEWSNYMGGR